MQIKTYKAEAMKDVLAQIRAELGPDAVILSTREVRDESFGALARPMVEVTAAVDFGERRLAEPVAASLALAPDALSSGCETARLEGEIAALKDMMQALLKHNGIEQRPCRLSESLVNLGVRRSLADILIRKLGEGASLPELRQLLTQLVKVEPAPDQRIWTFVGTTGVGKTTTVAKLAAQATLKEKKKVAIITLDTYRIGAVEQSRTYAKILGVPFVSVASPGEFRDACARLEGKDLILVDTVGRSALGREHIKEMHEFLDEVAMCKFLLLPVAMRDAELERVARNFGELGIDRVIFTKFDEAVVAGSILTHNLLFRTPVAYLTTGQRVPEDIEAVSPKRILDLCLGEMI